MELSGKWLLSMLLAWFPYLLFSQVFTSNGATIFINSGAQMVSNGGMVFTNSSNVTNNGELKVTKNSSFPAQGTISLLSASVVNGNGTYRIEQDWINNAIFNAGSSTVYLYGNTQQFITSATGTVTEFNNLVLQGNGVGVNRKKTLLNVDARVSTTGTLALNNRELETQDNLFSVLNPTSSAISNNQTFGAEGFISSSFLGNLAWTTNSTNTYYFPVGSSDGVTRYRPITIQPESGTANTFTVRMNNTLADNYGYFLAQHDPEIATANSNYFHSIERVSGTTNATIRISYLPSEDGDWNAMAHWKDNQLLWSSMGEGESQAMGNYSSVAKVNWQFPDVYHPYVLTTIMEDLFIPNVFTPNQDGVNDTYFVTGAGIKEFNMVIVNRWGNTVFQTDDIKAVWDGTTGGNPCQDGTYFYVVTAKSASKEYKKQGHITLNTGL